MAAKASKAAMVGLAVMLAANGRPFHIYHKSSPLNLLLPYQKAWVQEMARFKMALQARQTGKDFSSAADGISDIYRASLEGVKKDWLIAAPSERQSLEALNKWKEWTEVFEIAIADEQTVRDGVSSESLLKSKIIVFPNGSRVIAVPGRPDTVRGFCANVYATEFDFFERPGETMKALLPSVNNPMRGGIKRFLAVTTPNGIGREAHRLWLKYGNVKGGKWACHKTTIEEAVKDGLPFDIEEMREVVGDPEFWAQEYMCEFLDACSVLLPYELIALCETINATTIAPPDFWLGSPSTSEPIFLGIDFGRKKDLTVLVALVRVGDRYVLVREVLEIRNTDSPTQMDIMRERIRKAQRVCFDYTGPGVGLGDMMVKEFGEWKPEEHKYGKIELVTFTNNIKVDIFPKLRMACEAKRIGLPENIEFREDLHSVQRVVTQAGNLTYRAPRNEDGHADRCTALALGLRASADMAGPGFAVARSFGRRTSGGLYVPNEYTGGIEGPRYRFRGRVNV